MKLMVGCYMIFENAIRATKGARHNISSYIYLTEDIPIQLDQEMYFLEAYFYILEGVIDECTST